MGPDGAEQRKGARLLYPLVDSSVQLASSVRFCLCTTNLIINTGHELDSINNTLRQGGPVLRNGSHNSASGIIRTKPRSVRNDTFYVSPPLSQNPSGPLGNYSAFDNEAYILQ